MSNLQNNLEFASHWLERSRNSLVKIIIISGVIFVGAYMAPKIAAQQRIFVYLFLAYLGLIVTIFFLRWPQLGLILTLVGGMFVPFSGPSNLNVAVLGIAFLLLLWLVDMIVRQRKIEIVPSRTILPAFIFIIISILAFGLGQFPWFPLGSQAPLNAQLGGFAIYVLSVGAFILVANIIQDLRWLQALTWTFIALSSIYIVGRMIPGMWGVLDRFFQTGLTSGSLFWTWVVAIAFSQAIYNRKLHKYWRLALLFLVLAAFYDGIIQAYDWKSGWIPPLVAVAVIIGIKYWRKLWILLPLTILPAYDLATNSIGSDAYSWSTRLDAWRIVIQIIKADPILGLGFGNYHFYTPLIPIRGYFVQFNSHNQYIDLAAQTGLIGLGCILWFFWEVGKLGWWLRERVPEGFPQAYVYGALGGLAGTLFAGFLVDWFLPFVYNIGLGGFRASILAWVFLGGLVTIEQIINRQTVVREKSIIAE
jgi:O-Antigen ligase